MNLIPWKHKREEITGDASRETAVTRFRDEIDELFSRFFRDPWGGELSRGELAWGPRLDLAETDDAITVKAELPGVDANDININVTGNTLMIRGEKKHDREEKGRDFYYAERQYGGFRRAVQLPTSVDPDKVQAEFKNGVLTVTLGKNPESKPRRIAVKSE